MNTNRKIQIMASTVIAIGALALGLLTTNVAMACPQVATKCLSLCPSQQVQINICRNLNSGCPVTFTQCDAPGQGPDCGANAELFCVY